MNKVAITGYSDTKFSSDDIPIESSMISAVRLLFEQTSNLGQKDIDVVLTSTNDNKKYLAPIVSELSGIAPKISHNVENLCRLRHKRGRLCIFIYRIRPGRRCTGGWRRAI
ncbi:hypothetical protein [Candidatus Nitrosotenuis chungbukensis]|uniref:hypothetical protein n=1 Tax=Candidatus Nitrosotenuis chungbukensis TaxID=1353246 RepID=UPI002A4E1119|nr:hypothetical protein [Candidatus Nitrosotenuis chungbukensis]